MEHNDRFWGCWCSQPLKGTGYTVQGHRRLLLAHDLAWLAERGLEPCPGATDDVIALLRGVIK